MKTKSKTTKQHYIFICLCLFGLTLSAQTAPGITWQNALGGSDYDWASSIQLTHDGGYIVAGQTYSNDGDVSGNHGIIDVWIVKLSTVGEIQWQKALGGSDNDQVNSVQPTSEGGYIVAGLSKSNDGDVSGNHGDSDIWIVKLNSTGDIQWQKALGGSFHDAAYSIQQTTDGGYIVAGNTFSNDGDVTGNHGNNDYWVIKLSVTGEIQWQKALGGSDPDWGSTIQLTQDGGYIVAGGTSSNDGDVSGNHGSMDAWVVKLNADGEIQWQNAMGGGEADRTFSVQVTTEGGYVLAGHTFSNDGDVSGNHGGSDCWVVKLNAAGEIEWQRALGGSNWDEALSIQTTLEGGYIVGGWTESNDGDVTGNHGGRDYWVVKLNTAGELQWQKTLGGSDGEYAQAIQTTPDGGYVVAGATYSNDGDVSGNHGNSDYWVVKLDPDPLGLEDTSQPAVIVYPNPVKAILTIASPTAMGEVTIYNVGGKLLRSQKIDTSTTQVEMSAFPAGVYMLTIQSDSSIETLKVIKI